MGQCGCGDTQIDFTLPCPDKGYIYGFQIYQGCDYCNAPIGIIIYKLEEEDCFLHNGNLERKIFPYVKGELEGQTFISIIDTDKLKKHLFKHVLEMTNDEDLEEVVNDAVDLCLIDVINETIKESE
jgi:hypothetical protein